MLFDTLFDIHSFGRPTTDQPTGWLAAQVAYPMTMAIAIAATFS